ncbi:MAG TPA: STAS/SEC14 domain-containing protein [Stellaceae bacterium]|nr:STAS/SEC14 domain-containing protein [Stellaceae bacterium]
MIRLLTGFPDNVLALACEGHVTRQDYADVLIPAINAALDHHPKLRVYYEVTPQFTGIDAGAVWEDFRAGMEHLSRYERMACVTDVEWIRLAINAFRFLMPGALRVFPVSQTAEARRWIVADNP